MKIVVGAIIISIVLFLAALIFGYYWDDIKGISGDERSVPSPRSY